MAERMMKESGINYIGFIPYDWTISRIKNIVSTPVTTGAGEEAQNYTDNSLRYIRISDFDKEGNIIQAKAAYVPYEKGSRYLIAKGDILAATAGATVGKTMLYQGLDEPACYAGYLARISVDRSIMDERFLLYQTKCSLMDGFRVYYVKKSTIENISATAYGNMPVICPPLISQKQIVDFLDKKVSKIDVLISKTKESIEEYKKLKQAIITEAVTKGLDAHTEMASNNNPDIPFSPIHWQKRKIKTLFKIKKDIAGKEGFTVLSITQKGIIPKSISSNEGQLAADYSNYQIVTKGDFAMNHMDLLTGWVDISKYDGVTSPDYRVFVLVNKECYARYYLFFFQMCYSNKYFYHLGQGVSGMGRWRLQAPQFLNYEVPLPPYHEQIKIADYLDSQCLTFDTLISKKEQVLTELEQYKKSLIYEYVTGKKEVA